MHDNSLLLNTFNQKLKTHLSCCTTFHSVRMQIPFSSIVFLSSYNFLNIYNSLYVCFCACFIFVLPFLLPVLMHCLRLMSIIKDLLTYLLISSGDDEHPAPLRRFSVILTPWYECIFIGDQCSDTIGGATERGSRLQKPVPIFQKSLLGIKLLATITAATTYLAQRRVSTENKARKKLKVVLWPSQHNCLI